MLLKRQFPAPVRQDASRFIQEVAWIRLPEGLPFSMRRLRQPTSAFHPCFVAGGWAGGCRLSQGHRPNNAVEGAMEPVSTMLSYWGKARNSDSEGPPYHLLAYHSLDVAAVATEWWEQSRVLRSQCCYATGLKEAQAYAWVAFFIALHDYGKWDIRFQMKALHALQDLYPAFTLDMASQDSRYFHGPQGYAWFMWKDSASLALSSESLDSWQPWLAAVTGHHGSLPNSAEVVCPRAERVIIERDCTARLEWLHAIEALFLHPAGLRLEELPPPCPDLLAGFCAVCDWLGSNDQRFCYETKIYSLADYWRVARERARTALGESGLHGNLVGAGGMQQLFPKMQPRQLQTLVDTLPLQSGLTIVEAPTGSGKTELALAYASKLLAAGIAESIVFALPTQATANAMLQRLEEAANTLFTGGANVVLAHGKARYNPNFQALRQAALRPTAQTDPAGTRCQRAVRAVVRCKPQARVSRANWRLHRRPGAAVGVASPSPVCPRLWIA